MPSEIDSLQARVDAIRATGDVEFMHMTFLRLGGDLRLSRTAACCGTRVISTRAPYGDRIIQMLRNRPPCSSADISVPGVSLERRR